MDEGCDAEPPGSDAAVSEDLSAGLPEELAYEGSAERAGGVLWVEALPRLDFFALTPDCPGAINWSICGNACCTATSLASASDESVVISVI